MDLDGVADELYSLAPEDFIAARAEREKQAKASGDKELAARIRGLAKPNMAGWLANQLVREHAEEVAPLIELGTALREATAALSGQQLRDLGAQQRLLVRALVNEARQLASAHGRTVGDAVARGLEDTLHAAMADERAGELLLAGRLTGPLRRIGFAPADDAEAWPTAETQPGASGRPNPGARQPAGSSGPPKRSELLERAERNEARARTDAERASADLESAQSALAEAQERATAAADAVDRLRADLQRLTAELERASGAHRDAESRSRQSSGALTRAEQAAQRAMDRLDEATAQRQQLESQT